MANAIKIKIDTRSNIDLINIPAIIEKKTSPSLYSFFSGLKNVFKRRGTDKRFAA